MPELMKLSEVAKALKVSHKTVRRYVRQGKLPSPLRLSTRALRFRAEDIQKFLTRPEATTAVTGSGS